MQIPDGEEITKLLEAWRSGEHEAEERLLTRLYPQLKRLAAATVLKVGGARSLEAAELLHEAFLKLREQRQVHWQNRGRATVSRNWRFARAFLQLQIAGREG